MPTCTNTTISKAARHTKKIPFALRPQDFLFRPVRCRSSFRRLVARRLWLLSSLVAPAHHLLFKLLCYALVHFALYLFHTLFSFLPIASYPRPGLSSLHTTPPVPPLADPPTFSTARSLVISALYYHRHEPSALPRPLLSLLSCYTSASPASLCHIQHQVRLLRVTSVCTLGPTTRPRLAAISWPAQQSCDRRTLHCLPELSPLPMFARLRESQLPVRCPFVAPMLSPRRTTSCSSWDATACVRIDRLSCAFIQLFHPFSGLRRPRLPAIAHAVQDVVTAHESLSASTPKWITHRSFTAMLPRTRCFSSAIAAACSINNKKSPLTTSITQPAVIPPSFSLPHKQFRNIYKHPPPTLHQPR